MIKLWTVCLRTSAWLPDLVLVNPPRRGIGEALCDYLSQMALKF
jgi:tRNA/tmRNA/rRNA uracil-C5-methylase (TrmA/RlmC/RlmD family)